MKISKWLKTRNPQGQGLDKNGNHNIFVFLDFITEDKEITNMRISAGDSSFLDLFFDFNKQRQNSLKFPLLFSLG